MKDGGEIEEKIYQNTVAEVITGWKWIKFQRT